MAVGKTVTTRREVDGGVVVDYVAERMEQPYKGRLRRQFQKGLWFQVILQAALLFDQSFIADAHQPTPEAVPHEG